jgi:hypothetical protein
MLSSVFISRGYILYPYSTSTLLDNYGATYLVNNIALLEPRSFVPTLNDSVLTGTDSYIIIRRGRRILKRFLNRINGPKTEDLVLKDITVIKGFYINIISKKLLRNKGI